MDLGVSAKVAPLLADVRSFMEEEIAPWRRSTYAKSR